MYSLSGLCYEICITFGGNPGAGAFPGPDYWAIDGENITLASRAKAIADTEAGE
jgi:hypothetical protein